MSRPNLILNVTFHCDHSAYNDVAYFLKHRLIPNWRQDWDQVWLLELPDEQGYAVQIFHSDDSKLVSFVPGEDPDIQKVMQVYPQMVTFFVTLLKVLE